MGDFFSEDEDSTSSSLGLLDAEHVHVFRNALERILSTEIAETTFSEITDGLPTKATWLQFEYWNVEHPVNVLGHETLCDGAREKAKRFRDEFDIYILHFPSSTLHDFQWAKPETNEYLLSLIELIARACHQIAARLFQLDDGFHKHSVYEAWRDAPIDPESNLRRVRRRPSVFFHPFYAYYEQYPHGIADVVGYWAEARIFGGVVVFDRGPSGTERLDPLDLSFAYMPSNLCYQRRETYLHGGHHKAPLTLFPLTTDQFESLRRFLLQPDSGPCPLPIESSILNGYRYHPHDAMTVYNIFRDRYERNEPPTRSNHRRFMDGRNWPEMVYLFKCVELREKRRDGIEIDEAELAAAEEGMGRITPSSPQWPYRGWKD